MPEVIYKASKTLRAFHKDDNFLRGVMGPLGSGKSVGCSWEIQRRASEQMPHPDDGLRYTRWAVVRNTYRELVDTTMNTWFDWFPEEVTGTFVGKDMIHYMQYGDISAEIMFRALDKPKDVKKLLSLELTGAFINEAREIPKAVIDMIQGRVGRYPRKIKKHNYGPTWFGVIMDTNPPDNDHWWYEIFEEACPHNWTLYKQPSGTSPKAENKENLPDGYYENMQGGKTQEWINVYVHGQYGFIADGKSVYPEYSDRIHAADQPIAPDPSRVIIVGIDFGLTPACIFAQKDVMGRWVWIDELVSLHMGAKRFGKLLKQKIKAEYKGFEFEFWGDPAGDQEAQTDEKTPFKILRKMGINARPAIASPSNHNDWEIRRESVATPLSSLVDGIPGLLISPKCIIARKGMAGGYCFKRIQVAGDAKFHNKPDKNRFSHVIEGGQYAHIGGGEGKAAVTTTSLQNSFKVKNSWSPFGKS